MTWWKYCSGTGSCDVTFERSLSGNSGIFSSESVCGRRAENHSLDETQIWANWQSKQTMAGLKGQNFLRKYIFVIFICISCMWPSPWASHCLGWVSQSKLCVMKCPLKAAAGSQFPNLLIAFHVSLIWELIPFSWFSTIWPLPRRVASTSKRGHKTHA